jgi:hypothetical protein
MVRTSTTLLMTHPPAPPAPKGEGRPLECGSGSPFRELEGEAMVSVIVKDLFFNIPQSSQ